MKRMFLSAAACILPFAGVWAIIGVVQPGNAYGFLWVALWALAAYGGWRFATDERLRKNTRIYAWLLSAVYLALQVYGYQLNLHGGGTLRSIALCMVAALGLAGGLAWPVALFLQADAKPAKKGSGKLGWPVCFGIILLGWLPVFLAYYPGVFYYDVYRQLGEYLSRGITSFHPPLHTIWLGICYELGGLLGSHTVGIAIHVGSQMILLAAIFAYALVFLRRQGVRRSWCIALMLFIAVFPAHSIMVLSVTKDILFTGVFVLLVVELYRLCRDEAQLRKPLFWVRFILLSILLCLTRNNAAYALVLACPLLLLVCRRMGFKRVCALFMAALVLSFSAYTAVGKVFETSYVERTREMFSVPCQQLARLTALRQTSEEETQAIKAFIRAPENYYHPHLADLIRIQLSLKNGEEAAAFLKLWLGMVIRYPITCIDATLLTVQSLWWMDDTSYVEDKGQPLDSETRFGVLPTAFQDGWDAQRTSYIPQLSQLYDRLFTHNAFLNIPVFSLLLSPALYVWLTVLITFRALVQKQTGVLAASVVLLSCCATLLLASGVLIRFIYPLVAIVPMQLMMSFHKH